MVRFLGVGQTLYQTPRHLEVGKTFSLTPMWEAAINKETDSVDMLGPYGMPSWYSVCTPGSGSELSNDCTDDKFLDAVGLYVPDNRRVGAISGSCHEI